MAENTAITMSDSVMEQLRCFVCKGYLSCRPVRGLSDGSYICGRCSSNDVTVVARALVFEAVLSNISFPCNFKKNGCTQRLLFGETIDHEIKCQYRLFACPSSLTCSWKGLMSQIYDHFITTHPTLVKQKPNFKIDIDQDSNGTFVFVNNNITFIVKYLYDTNNLNLKYEIRFCNNSVANVSYNLQLINDSDVDCFTSLKSRDCSLYNDSFYDISKTTLELNKFIAVLDNPSCIRVSIDFKVQRVNINTENNSGVNYELLESLKCTNCCRYSGPPLYKTKGNIMCHDCKHYGISETLNDANLLQLATEINFPCRWLNCESVMKSNNLRNHELECNFRMYDCFLCKDTFIFEAVLNHYIEKHQAQQFTRDIFCFNFSFSKRFNEQNVIVVKNNKKCLLQYQVITDFDSRRFSCNMLGLKFYSSDLDMNSVRLTVDHKHCKVKSNVFQLKKCDTTYIRSTQLPPCFRNQGYELTGFIYLNEENIYKKHEK